MGRPTKDVLASPPDRISPPVVRRDQPAARPIAVKEEGARPEQKPRHRGGQEQPALEQEVVDVAEDERGQGHVDDEGVERPVRVRGKPPHAAQRDPEREADYQNEQVDHGCPSCRTQLLSYAVPIDAACYPGHAGWIDAGFPESRQGWRLRNLMTRNSSPTRFARVSTTGARRAARPARRSPATAGKRPAGRASIASAAARPAAGAAIVD